MQRTPPSSPHPHLARALARLEAAVADKNLQRMLAARLDEVRAMVARAADRGSSIEAARAQQALHSLERWIGILPSRESQQTTSPGAETAVALPSVSSADRSSEPPK